MNRLLLLVLIGACTFLVVLFLRRPDILKEVWLWLVGLAGPIVHAGDFLIKRVKGIFTPKPETDEKQLRKNINETGSISS